MKNMSPPSKNSIAVAFAKLTKRERVMVIALLVVIVVGSLVYFVELPTLRNLSALRSEVMSLQDEEFEIRTKIAETESYKKKYDELRTEYDTFASMFFRPMVMEYVDELVTGMMISSGLSPNTLSISTLSIEDIGHYIPMKLGGDGSLPGGGTAMEGEAETAAEEGSAQEDDSAQTSAAPKPVYSYTLSLSADGGMAEFLKFFNMVKSMTAIEMISYQIGDSIRAEEAAMNTVASADGSIPSEREIATGNASVTMQIKVYVFDQ